MDKLSAGGCTLHSISLFNTFTVYRHSADNVLFSISNALTVCYKESKVCLESTVTLSKLYPPAFCCSYLHLHLPPFPPNPLSFHSPSAIGSLIWERRTETEKIRVGMQGRVAQRILSTYGCLTQSPVQTPMCIHTQRCIWAHISHLSMHTYTQTHCAGYYQPPWCRLNRMYLYLRLKQWGLWGIRGEC